MSRACRVDGGQFRRQVKRAAVLARAKPFERLSRFRARMEQAAPACKMNGKPLVLSGVYVRKRVPSFQIFGRWVKWPVWTTTLWEQDYA